MFTESEIDPSRLPHHVAIIMDGNGRWAVQRNQPRLFGHKAGASSVKDVVETAKEIGVKVLTLYAFSSENWNRPKQEVSGLMSILKNYLASELARLMKNGIQLRCIGDIERFPVEPRKALLHAIENTSDNQEFILNLALSYGARDELVRATRLLARECAEGRLDPDDIDDKALESHLYTAGIPDPDLLIRTGGESRVSNFLLWQISYAEIYFTDVMWPDFRRPNFLKAIQDYQNRERRFGRTSGQLNTG